MISLQRILVPVDFSEPSAKALEYGRALAETFGATLHVLNVVEEPFIHGFTAEGYLAVAPDLRERVMTNSRERMEEALPEEERRKTGAVAEIRVGRPFEQILRFAKEKEIDLIVMGTHGRGGVAHFLLGSVTEGIVRSAPCPVLSVRHPEHEFVLP